MNDAYVFKLKYKCGLSYLPLEYLPDQDLEELPHVDFCSPREWKPDEANDNNDDEIWFDSLDDEEELEDDEFLDFRDGLFQTDEDLENPELERTVKSMQCALNIAKLCVNGLSYKKKPWGYGTLRPYFGWKPVE
eukprot:11962288-Ditylum_brightwellii.AAC.1